MNDKIYIMNTLLEQMGSLFRTEDGKTLTRYNGDAVFLTKEFETVDECMNYVKGVAQMMGIDYYPTENKQVICNRLTETLRATYDAHDVVGIDYDHDCEVVTVRFASGGKRRINVNMDSGTSMIRDIMANLGC